MIDFKHDSANSYRSKNIATTIKYISSHQCAPCSRPNHDGWKMSEVASKSVKFVRIVYRERVFLDMINPE